MEGNKPFKIVSVLRDGKAVGITSAYDAAVYILEKWPEDEAGCTSPLPTCLGEPLILKFSCFLSCEKNENIFP
jgi:hypothetical protein